MGAIGGHLTGRDNALNFVRLLLATTVIVAHTWPIGAYGREPDVGDSNIGHLAVAGFFVISGYLITLSRMRQPLTQYLLKRATRIFPAFWVCLLVTAFGIAPLLNVLTGSQWSLPSAISYVVRNLGLWIFQPDVAGGPAGVPLSGTWNGSLWTLSFEFAAYLCTAILFALPFAKRWPALTSGVVLAATITLQLGAPLLLSSVSTNLIRNAVSNALWLGAFYAAGALLATVRHRVPVRSWIAVMSLVILGISVATHTITMLGVLPMSYLVLWLGAKLPVRLGAKNDISYGVYIYAFPVQQSLAAVGLHEVVPFPVFAVAAFLITVPLAMASWWLVEKPTIERLTARLRVRTVTPAISG